MPELDVSNPLERLELEYLQRILTSRVYDVCIETPLQSATAMSKSLGAYRADCLALIVWFGFEL